MERKKSKDIEGPDPWVSVLEELRPTPPSRGDGWRSLGELRDVWGMNRGQVRRAIGSLTKRGRVECRNVGGKNYFKLT